MRDVAQVAVEDGHGHRGVAHDAAELLALALDGQLPELAFRDVLGRARQAQDLAARAHDGLCAHVQVPHHAVRALDPVVDVEGPALFRRTAGGLAQGRPVLGMDQPQEGGAGVGEGLGIDAEDRVQLGRAGHAVRAQRPFPAPDVRDPLRHLELLLAFLEGRGQTLLLRQRLGQLPRAGPHLAAEHAVPDDGGPADAHHGGEAQGERQREIAPGPGPRRDHEVLLHQVIEPPRLVQAVQRLAHPGELRAAPFGRRQRVGHGAQGQLDQVVQSQVAGGRAQGQPVAGGARHLAFAHGAQRIREAVGGDHLRPAARVQLGEEREGQRPRGHGDADARQILDGARSVRAVREHDLLLESPGLGDQVVPLGALLGEGQADEVHPSGVEVPQHGPPVLQADVDAYAGLATEGTDQLDVEPVGLTVPIDVLVGRERRVAAVDDDGRVDRRLGRPRGGAHGEDAEGEAASRPSPPYRPQEGRR